MATGSFSLPAREPFELASVALSHGWVQLKPFDYDPEAHALTYVASVNGAVTQVTITELVDRPGVSVTGDRRLSPSARSALGSQVTWMLGLDQDLAPFYELARGEPKLAHVIDGAHGRILRSGSFFEDTVKTILTTNTSWAGTKRMVAALVDRHGSQHPADADRHAFPTPAQLAAVDPAELREAGLGYRAPYISELARSIVAGETDLEGVCESTAGTDEIRKRLLAIKGIGGYAAAVLLMLLERYDFVPIDSWARTMVSREWHDGEPVGDAEIKAAFERWGTWQGLAYWFWAWSQA